MKPIYFFTLFLLNFCAAAYAQTEAVTVEQCRILALKNSPLQQKKGYAGSIGAWQVRNLISNNFPKIQAGAQASWQSDVFGLPFQLPGSSIPEIPKDQYKLTLEVSERIWDGRADRYQHQQRDLERDLAIAQVDVDAYSLQEIVTDLYFKALLLRESNEILGVSKKDLEVRLKQAEATVNEGVALRSSADMIKIQMLKTQQQIDATTSDYQAVLNILEKWVGQKVMPINVQPAPSGIIQIETARPKRPEFALFSIQQRGFELGKNALKLRNQPKIEAFVQGGLGRPNPFNLFETNFQPFVLFGLRGVWTPIDWGNKRRESQIFELQIKNVDVQRAFFEQRLAANSLKDLQDEAKWQAQVAQDDAIIQLQKDIVQRADAQVKNGVMTMTDYLVQLNLLTQAQLNRKSHEIQAVQAREMLIAKGIPNQ